MPDPTYDGSAFQKRPPLSFVLPRSGVVPPPEVIKLGHDPKCGVVHMHSQANGRGGAATRAWRTETFADGWVCETSTIREQSEGFDRTSYTERWLRPDGKHVLTRMLGQSNPIHGSTALAAETDA